MWQCHPMSPMSLASCSRNRETACGNCTGHTPSLHPKTVGHLQPVMSPPQSLWGISSFPGPLHRSGWHSSCEQAATPQHVRAPSRLGDRTLAAPQAWQGTHLSCINYVPFIFPSSWRDLGAESTAQTVSLASRERWHCDIREGRHAPPAPSRAAPQPGTGPDPRDQGCHRGQRVAQGQGQSLVVPT